MWISLNRTIAHYTEGEKNSRGAYVCLCGFDTLPKFCETDSSARHCKNCERSLANMQNQVGDFSRLKTRWGL